MSFKLWLRVIILIIVHCFAQETHLRSLYLFVTIKNLTLLLLDKVLFVHFNLEYVGASDICSTFNACILRYGDLVPQFSLLIYSGLNFVQHFCASNWPVLSRWISLCLDLDMYTCTIHCFGRTIIFCLYTVIDFVIVSQTSFVWWPYQKLSKLSISFFLIGTQAYCRQGVT